VCLRAGGDINVGVIAQIVAAGVMTGRCAMITGFWSTSFAASQPVDEGYARLNAAPVDVLALQMVSPCNLCRETRWT